MPMQPRPSAETSDPDPTCGASYHLHVKLLTTPSIKGVTLTVPSEQALISWHWLGGPNIERPPVLATGAGGLRCFMTHVTTHLNVVSVCDASFRRPRPTLEPPLLRGWLHVAERVVLAGARRCCSCARTTGPRLAGYSCFVLGVEAMFVDERAVSSRVTGQPVAPPQRMKRADHSAIFLAITGSYLPSPGSPCTARFDWCSSIVAGRRPGRASRSANSRSTRPKWANTMPFCAWVGPAVAVLPQIYRGGGPLCFAWSSAGGVAYTARRARLRRQAAEALRRASSATTSCSTPDTCRRRPQLRRLAVALRYKQRHHVVADELRARQRARRSSSSSRCRGRMRHAVDPDTPSAQTIADLIGDTWLTIAR